MSLQLPRYKVNHHLTDTTGFFDQYVPYTNQSVSPGNDSLAQYTDYSIYDYITPNAKALSLKPAKSIFQDHQLVASDYHIRDIHKQSTDWITGIVLINLFILAWIQTNNSKRLRQIIRSFALSYYVNQLEREGNLYNERITLGLGFLYFSSVSLMIFQVLSALDISITTWPNYLNFGLVTAGFVVFVMLRSLLVQLTGVIFKTYEQTHAYRLNSLIFSQTLGIFLFPILLLSIYWSTFPFLWIALGLFIIILIYRFMRSISIGLSNSKFSVFYLILYLCTLEILPILVLVKYIRQF